MPAGKELDFAAGAVSGVAECVAVQPFDMAKTRYQLMAGRGAARPSVSALMLGLLREGGVARLYRGMPSELLCMVPRSSVMWGAYESAARALTTANGGRSTVAVQFAAGLAAGQPTRGPTRSARARAHRAARARPAEPRPPQACRRASSSHPSRS